MPNLAGTSARRLWTKMSAWPMRSINASRSASSARSQVIDFLPRLSAMKPTASPAMKGGPPPARIVALGTFDLHHLGAEKRQDLPAIGPGQVLAELDDLDALKRLGHLRLLPRISRAITMRCTSLGP